MALLIIDIYLHFAFLKAFNNFKVKRAYEAKNN